MSEAAEKKKKGGKLPLILVVVVVLAAGGFFMKGKGKEEPKVKLGKIESLGDEFLVNLADGKTYLRAAVSVHIADGKKIGAGPKGDDYTVARDAVITVFKSKALREISDPEGLALLKREIAAAINKVAPKEEGNEEAEKSDKKKKKDDEESKPTDEEPENPEWDSDEGPVLKVYFTSFATQ